MPHELAAEMAPTGELRAALNMRNSLLITGKSESGEPQGLAPSMAAKFAEKLGVPIKYVPYDTPAALAESASKDEWDIAMLGADPDRAAYVNFTAPYAEIEATYLVPEASSLKECSEVDADGIRVAVCAKAAYDLWLERNIKKANVIRCEGHEATYDKFKADGLEALAGLRSKLTEDGSKLPGTRLLPGKFMAVEQAACTKKGRDAGFKMLAEFIEETKSSGLVAELMEKFGVTGKLSVAPAAEPESTLDPPPEGASIMKVTTKRSPSFYVKSAMSFLKGVEAKPAEEGKEAVEAKPPVDALRISGLGDSINAVVAAANEAVTSGVAEVVRTQTEYAQVSGRGCARIVIDLKRIPPS
mmetsp:Transcript_38869/g.91501  ORF Transcript_38869/g.91501 Transcript_38869/m.91501 type:complete len:357 (+) Transcript_38869:82-1152(+)|eukprot:CAMPEP_0178415250 /NCGR_PEP_ID=MMETSP0689_2-20121128/23455_1 /TAXON_ID=160604 /ORGANISM="Amphidinium massartii, Strain CS-259" /LENGTH=356 /DNA_ID=CAMNT_0020036565 /DNA_START=28 /DNA_END=1098 /DNA_ORIENTATION=+